MTIDKLALILMHVKEKRRGKGVRLSYVVVYLAIDPIREIIVISNPLYKMQVKTLKDLKEYCFGEVITVHQPAN